MRGPGVPAVADLRRGVPLRGCHKDAHPFFFFFLLWHPLCDVWWLPTNRHRLHTNRHRLPTNRHRLPTNRHRTPTGRHRRAYWTLRVFFYFITAPPGSAGPEETYDFVMHLLPRTTCVFVVLLLGRVRVRADAPPSASPSSLLWSPPGVPIAVDIWGVDGGFAMDLNILTMDLGRICLSDTYPCPALLPFFA